MSSIDGTQIFTLLFGAAVIVLTILRYNNNNASAALQRVLDQTAAGLGFAFAAYAIAAGKANKGTERNMCKYFVLAVAAYAWILLSVTITDTATGWYRVQQNIAKPLFEGSLFAVPIALMNL